VIAIALNIAKKFRNKFDNYRLEEHTHRCDYDKTFSRHMNFTVDTFKSREWLRMFPKSGSMFLKLFWDALVSLQQKPEGSEGSLYVVGNGSETLSKYLDLQGNIQGMLNEEIQETADYLVSNAFFVCQTIGMKNGWSCKPSMYLDLSKEEQVEYFCQKGTRVISKYINENKINKTYCSRINEDPFMANCPLIVSADVAVVFTPVEENKSLLVNGFISSKILSQFKKQTYMELLRFHQEENLMVVDGK